MYGPMVMTSLVIAGKTVLISSFYVNFSITGEMAPTLFRNLAVGSCSAFGKIGSFTAPYLMYLGEFEFFFVFVYFELYNQFLFKVIKYVLKNKF